MKNLIVISPQQTPREYAQKILNDTEIWFINDGNQIFSASGTAPHRVVDLPFKYGWGGIQKTVLRYAAEHKIERVTFLGFLPENLSQFLENLPPEGNYAIPSSTLTSKFFGRLLNCVSGLKSNAWYSLCHSYSMATLNKVGFELNTFGDHFDAELLLQLAGQHIPKESLSSPIKIPNPRLSLQRLRNEIKACLKFRLQKYGFLYDLRFHPEVLNKKENSENRIYESKFGDDSPHSLVLNDPKIIPPQSKVLDIGCSTGYVANKLVAEKNCTVVGLDMIPKEDIDTSRFRYEQVNLETGANEVADLLEKEHFDVVIMLDVLEHLANPELFLLELFKRKYVSPPKFVFSTGNVAFIGVRTMLMLGYFNYGDRGILDITHKRLFSYRTFRNLMEQTGFQVQREHFFPLPFQKLGVNSFFFSLLIKLNHLLIKVFPKIFSYQVLFETQLLTIPVKK